MVNLTNMRERDYSGKIEYLFLKESLQNSRRGEEIGEKLGRIDRSSRARLAVVKLVFASLVPCAEESFHFSYYIYYSAISVLLHC